MRIEKKKHSKVITCAAFAVVFSIAAISISGTFAAPPLAVLDTYDVGVNDAAKLAAGWGPVEPAAHGGTWGAPAHDGTIRVVWENFWSGAEQNSDNARSASFTLSHKGGNAKVLRLHNLDGLADDSFKVYVNGVLVFTYTGENDGIEDWHTTDVALPANIGADVGNGVKAYSVVIRATASAWNGFGTWGQVGFDWIQLLGTS